MGPYPRVVTMPANLTPRYRAAEEAYRRAANDRERLDALREMLATIPKHKGTEKLQADLKRKIARLRSGGGRGKGSGRRGPGHRVERSGAAQVALVGPPNSGKSRLVADLTHARPEVAEYPFTTRTPTPGIVVVDKIPLQLVDLPPVTAEHREPWLTELVRNPDLLLVLLDLGSDDLLDHWDAVREALAGFRVHLGEIPLEEREIGVRYLRYLVAGNKADLPGAADRLSLLEEYAPDLEVLPVSLETGEGLSAMLRRLVGILDVIRVYTKAPGREPDLTEPFVLPRGTTVEGAARAIHRELAANLRYARAWGPRFHDGQRVARDLELEDGDILEFHE